jgi:predicted Rossmann fold flavoprotein
MTASAASPRKRVLIVGGGSSGLMAAITAAASGAEAVLLERNDRVGKKLLATGNGRCNLTNMNLRPDDFHGADREWTEAVLGKFPLKKTLDFFESLGVACRSEEGGKVFPWSFQASAVLDVLRYEGQRLGMQTLTGTEVKTLSRENDAFWVETRDGCRFSGDRVVMACGGRAGPQFGSDGSAYRLVTALGHSLVEPFPAIVPLRLRGDFFRRLQGVKVQGRVEAGLGSESLRREDGEILFTEYGLSGPPVLQLSRTAGEVLKKGGQPWLRLDLFPEKEPEELAARLAERLRGQGHKNIEMALVGWLHKRLIPVLLQQAGIADRTRQCAELSHDERNKLAALLKSWTMAVIGAQPWPMSQVTAGGVDCRDVEATSLESRLVPGLHFCGEMLDVDGDCGGFNLQWAWSSGYVAGRHAALS